MKGAVACGHHQTAAAAEEILLDGGNAFDAVIAAHFAACVAEPVLASLGGGGYCLTRPASGAPLVYDFFAHSPRRPKPSAELDFYPIQAEFGPATQEFHIGLGAVATPGAVKGTFALHRDLGTLPMTRLVEPALRIAREGVPLSPLQAYIFEIIQPIYLATPECRETFAQPSDGNRLYRAGEVLRLPDMADAIEALAREGDALFYRGDIAAQIAQQMRRGGALTADDLAHYEVIKRKPLVVDFQRVKLLTNPAPASGGLLIGFGLKLLQEVDFSQLEFGSAQHLQLLVNVMSAIQQLREDNGHLSHLPDAVLDEQMLAVYREQIVNRAACNRGTTHISVVDGDGNAASLTVSNGEGCGHLISGTGIMLNNMLGEEDINPQGFHCFAPNQRMTSMMSPSMLETDNGLVVLGSGGSNRIRSAILQAVINLAGFGSSPQQAISAPRLHLEDGVLNLEPGYSEAALRALDMGANGLKLWPQRNLFFGGVHTVEKNGEQLRAEGDPRRDGAGRVIGG